MIAGHATSRQILLAASNARLASSAALLGHERPGFQVSLATEATAKQKSTRVFATLRPTRDILRALWVVLGISLLHFHATIV